MAKTARLPSVRSYPDYTNGRTILKVGGVLPAQCHELAAYGWCANLIVERSIMVTL